MVQPGCWQNRYLPPREYLREASRETQTLLSCAQVEEFEPIEYKINCGLPAHRSLVPDVDFIILKLFLLLTVPNWIKHFKASKLWRRLYFCLVAHNCTATTGPTHPSTKTYCRLTKRQMEQRHWETQSPTCFIGSWTPGESGSVPHRKVVCTAITP